MELAGARALGNPPCRLPRAGADHGLEADRVAVRARALAESSGAGRRGRARHGVAASRGSAPVAAVLGPVPSPIERIDRRTRWQMLLRARERGRRCAGCSSELRPPLGRRRHTARGRPSRWSTSILRACCEAAGGRLCAAPWTRRSSSSGDPGKPALAEQVGALGYGAELIAPPGVEPRLDGWRHARVIVVCIDDVDPPLFMASLRRMQRGAAIPVTLCGRMAGVGLRSRRRARSRCRSLPRGAGVRRRARVGARCARGPAARGPPVRPARAARRAPEAARARGRPAPR